MNFRQRLYDSNDSINLQIKINNTSALSKNLNEIRKRKPIFSHMTLSHNKKTQLNLEDYYRKKENLLYQKILVEIKKKDNNNNHIFNTEQNELINNNKISRKKYYKLNNYNLEKENESFKKRLNNQKPFISVKSLDKEYKERVRISRFNGKKNLNNSLILPPININK